jgi:hypothetical protein
MKKKTEKDSLEASMGGGAKNGFNEPVKNELNIRAP